jgi:Yip1 domain
MLKSWIKLAILTITSPREALRQILALSFTSGQMFLAIILVVVLESIPPLLLTIIHQPQQSVPVVRFMQNPMATIPIQIVLVFVFAFLIQAVGQLFGGKGRFIESLTAVVWLQYVLFLLQLGQFVLAFVSATLVAVLWLFSMGVLFYLLVIFIMEVHGFKNVLAVSAGIFVTMMMTGVVIAVLLTLAGVVPMGVM